MSNIPDSWIYALLSEIAFIQMGQSPNSRSYNEIGEGLPFFQGKADFGSLYPTVRKWCTEPKKIAEAGNILLSVRAPVGPTNLASERCCIGRGLAAIQAVTPFNQKYLLHFFRNIETWLSQQGTGTTFAGIGSRELQKLKVPVAPVDEQKRIVDKLDNLLARVDKSCDRLARAKDILERFRQTVIAAGMSGQLTQDWHISESAKARSQEVVGKLADFADVIDPNPSHRYPSYVGGTIPLLSTEQMVNLNDWNISSAKLATPEFYEARKAAHNFLDDDIIFARKGRLGLARNPPSNTHYVFSHSVFIIRNKSDKLLPSYLLWFLRQEWCVRWLSLEMNSNAGVPTLGKSVMQSLPIRIPERSEQQEVVRYIENFFDYADQIESHYQNALALVNQLKGTILSKAFRGELVAQDADNEPASDLLERIQTERTDKTRRAPSYRKPKMPKVNEEYVKKVISQLPRDVFLFDELQAKLTCDYDKLKDILFVLLDESEPSITQVFDQEAKIIQFVRRDK